MHYRRRHGALVAVEQILLACAVELALGLVGLVQPHSLDRIGGVRTPRDVHLVTPQLFLQLVLLQLVAHFVLTNDLLEAGVGRRLEQVRWTAQLPLWDAPDVGARHETYAFSPGTFR